MTGPTHLPNEILSVIINQLRPKDGDLKTLTACRLASYTLCSLATPVCFSSMHLDTGNVTAEAAVKWNQILSNNDIAGSVRTLIITGRIHELPDWTSGSIIVKILHRLPHIQNFTLRPLHDCYFNTISEDLGLAIRALFRSPNLKNVYLYHLSDFPLTLITTCPNLRKFSTGYVSFSVKYLLFFSTSCNEQSLYSRTMTWMKHQTCRVPTWKSWIFSRIPGILSARALETIGRLQKNSRDSTKLKSMTEMATTRSWPMIWISCFWLHKVLQQSRFTRPVTVRFILTLAS